jgi:uncharacterized protein with von Willebrand factor type A (vWA) domain
LLELFTKLREAGLPLGIDEYQLVLRAMQAGFGMTDQAALKRLCQTLWVKTAEEMQLFEYHFNQVMGTDAVLPSSKTKFTGRHRQISQITRYMILGLLAIGILLGVRHSSEEVRTEKPSGTTSQRGEFSEAGDLIIISTNKGSSLINQIALALLLILVLMAGFILVLFFRWVPKRVAQQGTGQSISSPQSISSANASALPLELTQTIKDEVQVAQAVLQATSKNEEISEGRLILTSEYFPVTERQMKQIWRYLRRPVREGAATELDLEATANQIGRQGILLEPVLVPRRVNRAELLLLIDQDGSMVPFHSLSHRLAETALRGGRLGRASIYYFHNCPIEYLYHDPNHQQAELVSDIVTHVCSDRTAVLIFSDAGAARGGYNEERYKLTKEFLAKLKQRVHYIAWLNPMPRSRWNKTTAGEIARLVPMFELSRRGLQDAIGVLRGRPTNFQGQRK